MAATGSSSKTTQPTGYHRLAELMGPYQEGAIFRRFGPLAMINLLSLQAELVELDDDFRQISRENNESNDEREKNFSKYFHDLRKSEEGGNAHQYQKLLQIRKKLDEYYTALLQAAQVSKLAKADKKVLEQLRGWIAGSEEGGDFLQGAEFFTWDAHPKAEPQEKKDLERDLITLHAQPIERDPASEFVTSKLIRLYAWFRGSRHPERSTDRHGGAKYYTDDPFARFNKILVSVVSSALPVISIVALYYIKSTIKRIGALVAFTVIFACVLATFTNARRLEIFATTSTFAAVEVVFIGTTLGSE